jgi:hypothetical protein
MTTFKLVCGILSEPLHDLFRMAGDDDPAILELYPFKPFGRAL